MLPNEAFSPERLAILQQVETKLSTGYPVERLLAQTGVRDDDLSSLLRRQPVFGGKYSGATREAETFSKLEEWLSGNGAESNEHAGIAVTPTFKKIQGLIAMCHQKEKMIAITGGVGVGKSRAAAEYVKAHPKGHNRPGAVRVEFDKTNCKPAAALVRILGCMRAEPGGAYRNGQLLEAIGTAYQPGDLLILDECNYLQEAADVIRSLHDRYGVAIVMIGNPEFTRKVWGTNGRETGYGALVNRTPKFEFPATTEGDVDAWLAWAGLQGERLRKAAIKIACRPGQGGGLRTLSELIDYFQTLYPDEPLDDDKLLKIANMIGRHVTKVDIK